MNDFSIVILSKYASNLVPCLEHIACWDEQTAANREIIVVDDGAKAELKARGDFVTYEGLRWVDGESPFSFPRNANRGVLAAGSNDVLLLNDDALLRTPQGFQRLHRAAYQDPAMMLCSAVCSFAGNQGQMATEAWATRLANGEMGKTVYDEMVCFICLYLKREVFDAVGLFDERFDGYGWDDDVYCAKVRLSLYKIGIYDGCFVDHSSVPSSYRVRERNTLSARSSQNHRVFKQCLEEDENVRDWHKKKVESMKASTRNRRNKQ